MVASLVILRLARTSGRALASLSPNARCRCMHDSLVRCRLRTHTAKVVGPPGLVPSLRLVCRAIAAPMGIAAAMILGADTPRLITTLVSSFRLAPRCRHPRCPRGRNLSQTRRLRRRRCWSRWRRRLRCRRVWNRWRHSSCSATSFFSSASSFSAASSFFRLQHPKAPGDTGEHEQQQTAHTAGHLERKNEI